MRNIQKLLILNHSKNLISSIQNISEDFRDKICIIGNSGCSKQDNLEIEKSDIVVRFNNYATRQKIQHTSDPYRCDVLFSTFDLHSEGCKPKDVVIGIPYPFKARDIIRKCDKWYPDSRIHTVNPYMNLLMCEELNIDSDGHSHPIPSIGFTALWHMKDWDCDMYIGGFEWYYKDGKFQNWDLKNKNYPKNWNHNYPKEVEWILKNLRPKLNIKFSDKCNRILDIAEKLLRI